MFLKKLKEKLESKIEKIIEKYGFELVELQIQNAKDGIILKVFIDHVNQEDITLKDCEFVSKIIEESLDEEPLDIDLNLARLEVSSPGIDRLIRKKKDFERFKGSNIKIVLDKEIKNKKRIIVKLQDIKDDVLEVEIEGETAFIPLSYIKEARLYVSDKDLKDYLKRRKV